MPFSRQLGGAGGWGQLNSGFKAQGTAAAKVDQAGKVAAARGRLPSLAVFFPAFATSVAHSGIQAAGPLTPSSCMPAPHRTLRSRAGTPAGAHAPGGAAARARRAVWILLRQHDRRHTAAQPMDQRLGDVLPVRSRRAGWVRREAAAPVACCLGREGCINGCSSRGSFLSVRWPGTLHIHCLLKPHDCRLLAARLSSQGASAAAPAQAGGQPSAEPAGGAAAQPWGSGNHLFRGHHCPAQRAARCGGPIGRRLALHAKVLLLLLLKPRVMEATFFAGITVRPSMLHGTGAVRPLAPACGTAAAAAYGAPYRTTMKEPGLKPAMLPPTLRLPCSASTCAGDLWSGNIAAVEGQPAIFDPATYYGHHEAEWGMSWCVFFPLPPARCP